MRQEELLGLGMLQGAALLAIFGIRARLAASTQEVRVRVLETLAVAVRRGAALPPVLEASADEAPRRLRAALRRASLDLEGDGSLSGALEGCAVLRVPHRTIDALRAAEGGAAVAGVLSASVRDEAASRTRRHLPKAEAIYVVFVALAAAPFVLGATKGLERLASCMDWTSPRVDRWSGAPGSGWGGDTLAGGLFGLTAALLVALALVRLARWLGKRPRFVPSWSVVGEIPPLRATARLAGAARFLDALAAHVRSGAPLSDAARAAAVASGNRSVARGAEAFANAASDGDPAADAWALVPLPAVVRARAVAACASPRPVLADALDRLAAECRAAVDRKVEALSRWIAPVGLVALGFGAAWIQSEMFGMLEEARRHAMETPTW